MGTFQCRDLGLAGRLVLLEAAHARLARELHLQDMQPRAREARKPRLREEALHHRVAEEEPVVLPVEALAVRRKDRDRDGPQHRVDLGSKNGIQ